MVSGESGPSGTLLQQCMQCIMQYQIQSILHRAANDEKSLVQTWQLSHVSQKWNGRTVGQ